MTPKFKIFEMKIQNVQLSQFVLVELPLAVDEKKTSGNIV